MASVMDVLREVMTLTTVVGGLKSDVERIMSRVEIINDRVIRLEERDSYREKMMDRFASAAASDRLLNTPANALQPPPSETAPENNVP